MRQVKVQLMVPTFNSEATLKETLRSLTQQNYRNFEIHCFDNGSTDRTHEIIESMGDQRVHLHINSENLGGEGNFNKCIEEASGDFFAICHSDDVYRENFIRQNVKLLTRFPKAGIGFCHALRIDGKGRTLGERYLPLELDNIPSEMSHHRLLYLVLKYGNFLTSPSAFFRTSFVKECNLKFNGHVYSSSADLGLWLEASRKASIAFHPRSQISYRESDASYSHNLKKLRTYRHGFFKVMDVYAPQGEYFEFLKYKDAMLRRWNTRKANSPDPYPESDFSRARALSCLFSSQWHFEFGIKALVIDLLTGFRS